MKRFPLIKWFNNISIAKKLYFVVSVMAVLILIELFTLWFSMNTLSSIRALVGAEGLWSKSQKDAIYHLRKYGNDGDEKDYQAFHKMMKVPLGDSKARMELLKKNPDLSIVHKDFVEGGNHPEDVVGMTAVLTRFYKISYIKTAISAWSEADPLIAKLIPISYRLHQTINSRSPSRDTINNIFHELDPLNEKLTQLENKFSASLGEGSRWLENLVLQLLLAIAITVEVSGLLLTYSVSRRISKGINEVMRVSKDVAKGNFSNRAAIFSNDEIGILSATFNNMIDDLQGDQEKIRDSEESYRTLVNNTTDLILSLSLDGKILFANQAWCEKMGYSIDELKNLTINNILLPQHHEEFINIFKEIVLCKKSRNIETELVSKDGTKINVSGNINCKSADGKPFAIQCFLRDVTAQKLTEVTLATEVSYITLLQTVATASNNSFLLEEAAQITINEICELTKWPIGHLYIFKQEKKELESTNIWHLDDINKFKVFKEITDAATFPPGIGLPGRIYQKKEPVWIIDVSKEDYFSRKKIAHNIGINAAFGFPVLVNDEVVAVLEFFSDKVLSPNERLLEVVGNIGILLGRVVERQRAILQVKDSEEQIQTIFNNAPDGVILIDEEGKITRWNPRAEIIFGWLSEEVIGKYLHEVIIPERFVEKHQKGMQHFLKTKEGPILNKQLELPAIRKDKTEFDAGVRISPTFIKDKYFFIGFITDISIRKKNEEALKNKTTQLTEAQGLAHIGSWEWDVVTGAKIWSDELYKIFGYTPQEFEASYEEYLNRIHPDDRELVDTSVRKAFKDRVPATFEIYHRVFHKDGTERIVSGRVNVTAANGFILKMTGTVQDVTEIKRVEAELKNKTNQLIEAQALAHIGSWEWNVLTNKIVWSDELYKIFGFIPEEFEANYEDYLNHIHVDDREYMNSIVQKALNDRQPYESYHRVSLKNGTERIVRGLGNVFTDNNGKVVRMAGTTQDVTEQSSIEKSLREFKHFFNSSADFACIANVEGYFEVINPNFEKVLGYSKDELLNNQFLSFVHPDDIDSTLKEVEKLKSGATTIHFINRYRKKDGKYLWFDWNSTPNTVTGKLYAIARDITKQKEDAEELIRLKELAESSEKAKEQFLANMSHEIRTPLNAIMGFTDLLLKRNLGDTETDFIKTIKTSGENLLTIINDILDVSKIEAGVINFEHKPLNIKELLMSITQMLSEKSKEKNLTLSFICEKSVPDILLGDNVRLSQILINLVGNAIKFTQKGKVEILAKLLNEKNETVNIGFTVTDTGIGIPEDKLEHIFGRFRQAESHTTRNYGGTGLGLSIAKDLVTLQGGVMSVSSKVGKGSQFSFTLPFKKSQEIQLIKQEKQSNIINTDIKELNILIVEDNLINIKLITSLFTNHGIHINIAENGKLAVEKIKKEKYDIILMDIEMPVMNGYEATTIIRKKLKNDIPIIAMTAHAMVGEKEKCLNVGMNDFITKPISAHLLFEKIHNLTSNSVTQ